MILNSAVKALGILSITALVACGGSGSNPVTGGDSDDGAIDNPGSDPNVNLENAAFLFDTDKNLIANSFVFNPGATPGTGTISINNLPFDGVSSQGGEYTPRPGVVLPNGTLYENNPQRRPDGSLIEDQYFAVVLTSPNNTGTLVGTVATNTYVDANRSFGGAYASRTDRGLPGTRPASYVYEGSYNGLRIVRQVALPGQPTNFANNTVQATTGDAEILLDMQDFDLTGAIRGDIINRQLFDLNGNPLGALSPVQLIVTDLDPDTLKTTEGQAIVQNRNTTTSQSGEWTGLMAGPNGEEVAGFLLLEGLLDDADPNFDTNLGNNAVTGRETGGFIASRP
ncbi:hypothetical protein [Litoreibacter arenae]|uniref:Uncharacterized protein n=1 Tax=Litoreibacter arenae DSM 19593 TaxID=1123360 RepID=S9QJL8_9RHOB|nr:hypothetical protein [Litoreibacter arenae]EPX79997.1 hypothetical protein thalar_01333 [Litoreibacter arenae DSM 19593]